MNIHIRTKNKVVHNYLQFLVRELQLHWGGGGGKPESWKYSDSFIRFSYCSVIVRLSYYNNLSVFVAVCSLKFSFIHIQKYGPETRKILEKSR